MNKNKEILKIFVIAVIIYCIFVFFISILSIIIELVTFGEIYISLNCSLFHVLYFVNMIAFSSILLKKINYIMFNRLKILRFVLFSGIALFDFLMLLLFISVSDYLIVPIYFFSHFFMFIIFSLYSSIFIALGLNPFRKYEEYK